MTDESYLRATVREEMSTKRVIHRKSQSEGHPSGSLASVLGTNSAPSNCDNWKHIPSLPHVPWVDMLLAQPVLCNIVVCLPLNVYLLHLPRLDGSFGVTTGHASPALVRGDRGKQHEHEVGERVQGSP